MRSDTPGLPGEGATEAPRPRPGALEDTDNAEGSCGSSSDDNDGEDSQQDGQIDFQLPSVLAIARRIRTVLVLLALENLQAVILGPSMQYIITSFFAEAYGEGNCEKNPTSGPCRRGAADKALYSGASGGATCSAAWIITLLLGSWSDKRGRVPFLRAKSLAGLLPYTAFFAYSYGGTTMWVFLLLVPVVAAFDTLAVVLACMNDLVSEPEMRTVAYGVLLGSNLIVGAVALPFGSLLPLHITPIVSFAIAVIELVFVFLAFPETAPSWRPESKVPSVFSVLRIGCRVFSRNEVIFRMACILVLNGLAAAGLSSTLMPYGQSYLGMDRKLWASLAVASSVTVFPYLIVLRRLVNWCGESGVLRFSLFVSATQPLLVPFCQNKWQFYMVCLMAAGPILLAFPVISSIKSSLVNESEQGLVQGSLAAVRVIAYAFSDVVFGWLYRHSTAHGTATSNICVMPPMLLSAFLAGLAWYTAWPLPRVMPPPMPVSPSHAQEEETSIGLL